MDINTFDVVPDQVTAGVRKEIGPGAFVTVASTMNPAYVQAVQQAFAPFRAALEARVVSEEQAFKIRARVMSEHILMNWEGIQENGKEVPYSKEQAYKWLSDPKKRVFHDLVLSIAEDHRNYQAKTEEVSLGNLSEVSKLA